MLRNWLLNNKPLGLVVLILLVFISCKKDRLKGDKEVLVGTWRWDYTIRDNNPGTNSLPHFVDTITPLTEGDTYKMEFYKNGKVHLYKNEELLYKKRTVFDFWEFGSLKEFTISLNNDVNNRIRGSLHLQDFVGEKDTLVTWSSFPFSESRENCNPFYFDCFKTNVFVKE